MSRVRQLDVIVNTGATLERAIIALPRVELQALADRLGINPHRETNALRTAVRMRVVGLRRKA